ncbi:M60 family metallopeptidase [Niabella drilacis]|uniref:Peptidase M60, enhancin and enhancin-like n=1 Tax=Niabella drilacis (strain DSM 25811 / CCM 8410 / CCUG 62505 / LMG 26954 / E90) TaxID=1285928 RepID=A0A1G6I900_NIADE|nr:M60 family metallopeptidase [Niabella drilacis]SDC02495.1 Peptidase M60, enhancin and enhancin-like [Niabella drilacis]
MKDRLPAFARFAAVLLVLFCWKAYAQEGTDRVRLLTQVQKLPLPDSVFAAATYPLSFTPEVIATANLGNDVARIFVPAIISSRIGKGKLLIIGSGAYLNSSLLNSTGVQQFLLNVLSWAGQNRNTNVGLIGSLQAFQNWLTSKNYSSSLLANGAIPSGTSLLFCNTDITHKEQLQKIRAFVEAGGCFVLASPLFGRSQADGGSKHTLHLQTLLYAADLFHVTNFPDPAANNNQLTLDTVPRYLNIRHIIEDIRNNNYANYIIERSDIVAATILSLAVNTRDSVSSSAVYDTIMHLFNLQDTANLILPGAMTPLFKSDWKKYLGYQMQSAYRATLAEKDPGYINPEAKNFPGPVAPLAQKVTKEIIITPYSNNSSLAEPAPSFKRWYSTGLYAPAGARVTIKIARKDIPRRLAVQIGAHSDQLFELDMVSRCPYDLTASTDLEKDTTTVHSSFGGLIYIKIPDTDGGAPLCITISGAVNAPYFQLGKTTRASWQQTIRNYPAPWAEIASDKLILTVPSSRIRNLEDPRKLMLLWDSIMDADADLAAIPRKRKHPERIVVDRNVAYAYMYTTLERITVPDDESCKLMLDADLLRKKGSWGHFHELGHRHQFWGIDHSELSEVTVNLYTMYVFDKVLGKGLYNHKNISSRAAVREMIRWYLQSGKTYEEMSRDPFLYLSVFIPIIDEMGWQPILNLHKNFRAILNATPDRSKLEADNNTRRNSFYKALCTATHKDLTRYFALFRIPVSEEVKKEAALYPAWLPHYFVDPAEP